MEFGFELMAQVYLYGLLVLGIPSAVLSLLARNEDSVGVLGWLLFPCRAWQEYRHQVTTSVNFVLLDDQPQAYLAFMALIWPLRLAFNMICWMVIAVVMIKDYVLNTGVSSGRSHPSGLEA